MRKADDIRDIPHNTVREKQAVYLTAAVGKPQPVEPVNERQRAVVIAVEYGGFHGTILRQLAQPAILPLPVVYRMCPHGRAVSLRCPHVFGAAVSVLLNERVRHLDDLPRRAVVLLHIEYLGVGIDLIKFGQRLRVGRAEAVNTLILIADQKQIAVLPGQQPDNSMLDFRGVLCLIDAEIAVLRLHSAQYLGVFPQDAQGVDHLVVVIHLLARAQRFVVSREKGRKINSFDLDLSQRVAL